MVCPICRRALPHDIFDIEPRFAFNEQFDNTKMSGQCCLMKRCGMALCPGRVVAVGVFSRVEQGARDFGVTILCSERQRQMTRLISLWLLSTMPSPTGEL